MDDGDSMCRPILVPSFLQELDVANAKVEEEQNQKAEVIFHGNDVDAALLESRIRDVQSMAKVSTVTAGSITFGVAVGPRQYIADQLLGKADVTRAVHERVQLCQGPQTESPSSERVWELAHHSCTPGSSHSSQAAYSGNDPRRSLGRPSTRAAPGDSPCHGHRNSHFHQSQRR